MGKDKKDGNGCYIITFSYSVYENAEHSRLIKNMASRSIVVFSFLIYIRE